MSTDSPVFREPWEAQAFALARSLQERGVFSSKEWAAALGEEIKKAQAEEPALKFQSSFRPYLER